MFMNRTYFFFLLFGMLSGCGGNSDLLNEEKTAIVNGVRAQLKTFQRTVKKDGLAAQIEFMDNSEDFFWTPNGYDSALGYDSLSKILRLNASKYKSVTNIYDTITVIPLSKTLASYTGRIRTTLIDTLGNRSAYSMIETGVVVKRKKKWLLLNGQTSIINN